jgi:predicted enzyme related to lactoylglutathione lyase
MSINVKELAFVFHPVTDVARARKFYEGFLGLKTGMKFESPAMSWIEYDVAGQALAISNGMPGSPQSSLALEVADILAARQAAQSAGVELVGGVLEFPPCRMFQVKDPDGNQIILHQRKPQNDGVEKS